MNRQNILCQPFDIETHKKNFIDYLEVIVSEDGTVMYAVPSHQQKLIAIACKKLNVTTDELNDMCPPEYYFDFDKWLCKITNCVALWNQFMVGVPNEAQTESIKSLIDAGLYRGAIS